MLNTTPSSTTLSQITFINEGPLTTTFTPPPSCATATPHVVLGIASAPSIIQWDATCSQGAIWKGDTCYPQGTGIPQIAADNPLGALQVLYFSPGLHCPSGWTSAGIAARSADGPVSSSGAFSPVYSLPTSGPRPIFPFWPEAMIQILEPNETAVACCPSSMTAIYGGGCLSTLPSYRVTAGCQNIFNGSDFTSVLTDFMYNGTTATELVMSLTATSPDRMYSRTFAPDETSSYIGVSRTPQVILVHRSSDIQSATPSSAATTSSAGAAQRLLPGTSPWGGLGTMLGVCTAAMAAGAALIFW